MTHPIMEQSSLKGMIERVKAATGPDRRLEADIAELAYGSKEAQVHENHDLVMHRYLSSIDAALALVGRCLPGWHIEMLRTNYCAVEMWKPDERGFFNSGRDPIVRRVEGATLPLAILLALLTALSQESNHDHQ